MLAAEVYGRGHVCICQSTVWDVPGLLYRGSRVLQQGLMGSMYSVQVGTCMRAMPDAASGRYVYVCHARCESVVLVVVNGSVGSGPVYASHVHGK